MPSKTMTASQIDRFIRSMEEQGVGVTRIKKGLFLRLPDKTSTTVHFTNSDVRAADNLMGILRRAGVRHPDDPKDVKELPTNITGAAPVAPRSMKKVHNAIAALGWPDVVTVQQMVEETGMVHITTTRTLYQMGFKPVKGKRGARDWLTPQEILDQKPQEEEPVIGPPDPVLEAELAKIVDDDPESPTFSEGSAEEAEWLAENLGTRTGVVSVSPEREFIDTHDSWTVDLDSLSRYTRVHEYIEGLQAAGLKVEIRVWKA